MVCAHCRKEIFLFKHDEIDQQTCEEFGDTITTALQTYFRLHFDLIKDDSPVQDNSQNVEVTKDNSNFENTSRDKNESNFQVPSDNLDVKSDGSEDPKLIIDKMEREHALIPTHPCQSFALLSDKKKILEFQQRHLHEYLNYEDHIESSWFKVNYLFFDFVGRFFLHHKDIIKNLNWTPVTLKKDMIEHYPSRGVERMCSSFKQSTFTSNEIQKIIGTKQTPKKPAFAEENVDQNSKVAQSNRIDKAVSLEDDNDSVKALSWIMHIDRSKLPKNGKPNPLKFFLNKVNNPNAIAPTTLRYFIGGDQKQKNVRIIDKMWIQRYCNLKIKERIQAKSNIAVSLTREDQVEIRKDAKVYVSNNISYIHKFYDKKSGYNKFCRAELSQDNSKNAKYDISYDDIIEYDFLNDLVTMNDGIEDWYNEIMLPENIDMTFPVPVTSVKTIDRWQPLKMKDAPIMKYPQYNSGLCGLCSLASAFFFNLDEDMANHVYLHRDQYFQNFINKDATKKNQIMKFLKQICYYKKREYEVKNHTGKTITPSNLKNNSIYYDVVVGLLKDTRGSKDHIISFCKGWIFDSNLHYGIPINNDNLNWCCGIHINGAKFDGFHELLSVKKKRPKQG